VGGGGDASSDEDDSVDSSPISCSRTRSHPFTLINGLFLSAAGMGSCGFHAKDEKAGYRYGPRFWLGVVVVWVEKTQYPRWGIDIYWSAGHRVRGILH